MTELENGRHKRNHQQYSSSRGNFICRFGKIDSKVEQQSSHCVAVSRDGYTLKIPESSMQNPADLCVGCRRYSQRYGYLLQVRRIAVQRTFFSGQRYSNARPIQHIISVAIPRSVEGAVLWSAFNDPEFRAESPWLTTFSIKAQLKAS